MGKGKNREKQQANKEAKRAKQQGNKVADSERKHESHYFLDNFKPNDIQLTIADSYYCNDLTIVQGSSGTGKTTMAIYLALQDLKERVYDKIIFVKTPSELGDDQIGALKGGLEEKLEPHFRSMRGVFYQFMTKEKLKMEEQHGNIEVTVPNYLTGETIDDAIFIIDEGQLLSPSTTKFMLERAGPNCKTILLGDRYQDYSIRYRKDGFSDFIGLVTKINENGDKVVTQPSTGYIKMNSEHNMRSEQSKRIVKVYEERFEAQALANK